MSIEDLVGAANLPWICFGIMITGFLIMLFSYILNMGLADDYADQETKAAKGNYNANQAARVTQKSGYGSNDNNDPEDYNGRINKKNSAYCRGRNYFS